MLQQRGELCVPRLGCGQPGLGPALVAALLGDQPDQVARAEVQDNEAAGAAVDQGLLALRVRHHHQRQALFELQPAPSRQWQSPLRLGLCLHAAPHAVGLDVEQAPDGEIDVEEVPGLARHAFQPDCQMRRVVQTALRVGALAVDAEMTPDAGAARRGEPEAGLHMLLHHQAGRYAEQRVGQGASDALAAGLQTHKSAGQPPRARPGAGSARPCRAARRSG